MLPWVKFLNTIVTNLMMIPLVCVMMPWWRYPAATIRRWAVLMAGGVAAVCGVIWFIYPGPGRLATFLAGTAIPALCLAVFLRCCDLRDGRAVFLLATVCLDTMMCDLLASIFFAREDPRWVLARVLIFVIQGVLLVALCRKPLWRMLEANEIGWLRISSVPIALWLLMLGAYLPEIGRNSGRMPVWYALLLCATALLVYYVLYYFQRAILEKAEDRHYTALLRSEMDALRRQAEQAVGAGENMHALRHDLRHFIALLRVCLDRGEPEAAREVLDRLEQDTDRLAPSLGRSYTENPILDAALNQCADRCRREDVDFQVELHPPGELRVDVTELAVVLSNALENAVNAAVREEQPRLVRVFDQPSPGQWFLVVANTFTGTVDLDEVSGLPKTGTPGHGYGTYSIAGFARRYGCTVDCRVKDGSFALRLLI